MFERGAHLKYGLVSMRREFVSCQLLLTLSLYSEGHAKTVGNSPDVGRSKYLIVKLKLLMASKPFGNCATGQGMLAQKNIRGNPIFNSGKTPMS